MTKQAGSQTSDSFQRTGTDSLLTALNPSETTDEKLHPKPQSAEEPTGGRGLASLNLPLRPKMSNQSAKTDFGREGKTFY